MRNLRGVDLRRVGPVNDSHTILVPVTTHWAAATCEDVDCLHYLNGWKTIVPAFGEGTQMATAEMVRRAAAGKIDGIKRAFTEEAMPGGLVEFTFPAGQVCFKAAQHRMPSGRPPVFVRRIGEREPQKLRQEDWVDSMHEHVDKTIQLLQKG